MNILLWFLGPIGRYAAIALAALLAFGGFVLKQRHDAVLAERARVERATEKAVNKGNAAKENALRNFDKSKGIPNDGFARD